MKYIDLTHIIDEDMPVYPGTEKPKIHKANSLEEDGFVEHILNMYSHTGTHMDAPAHLLKNGSTLDNYKLDKFIGKAVILEASTDEITKDYIIDNIANMRNYDFLIIKTKWYKYWGDDKYFGNYPALTKEAAEYLSQSNLKGIGIDCISIDKFNSKLVNHEILLGNDLIIIENLKLEYNLPKEFKVFFMPLKFSNSDGAPIRAFAEID